MSDPLDDLTDKEKETLRLIVRGHDAKSAARELDLSVHTINERLRSARRKLDVTSSREAARMLLESEDDLSGVAPEKPVYDVLGGAAAAPTPDDAPITAFRSNGALWTGGIIMVAVSALALAFAAMGPFSDSDAQDDARTQVVQSADAEREAAARKWLALVDAQDWQASYETAGSVFQEPNTVATWRSASEQARGPLGAVTSRKAIAFQTVASPEGYVVVRFETDFENRDGVIESVTLQSEDGELKVVGYFLS
ncbi:MAG: helix-turn-helix domain-containing protein [Erythrobacter sp.]